MAKRKPRKKPLAKKSLAGTRKSVLNKRRRGFLAVFIPWMQRFGIVLGILTFVIWAGAWLWLNGSFSRAYQWGENRMELAGADLGFKVKNILVEGRVHTDPEIILAVLNVEQGDPLFSFDPRAARRQLEKIGWIRAAHVQRRFPDTLYIELTERIPGAVWKEGASMKLLDEEGAIIPTASMKPFKDLLIVQGEGAPENAAFLIRHLNAEPGIKARALAASYISQRRWDVVLKGGITVQLPEEDLGFALRRLAQAHEESGLLDRTIMAVDVRKSDRISIRTQPGQTQQYERDYRPAVKVNTGNPI